MMVPYIKGIQKARLQNISKWFTEIGEIDTYKRTPSTRMPTTVLVLPPPPFEDSDMMSNIKRTVHVTVLKLFMVRNTSGFNLWRARRTISVIVRMRHMQEMASQIGKKLKRS